jgi:hypothetical protein
MQFVSIERIQHYLVFNKLIIFLELDFLDIHDFKLQRFRTTLDDSLILNDNLNDTEFSSVVMIPFFKIKKKRMYGMLHCLSQNNFMSTISLFSLKIIF